MHYLSNSGSTPVEYIWKKLLFGKHDDDQHFPVPVGGRRRDRDRGWEEHTRLRADHGPVLKIKVNMLIFALCGCTGGFWAGAAVDDVVGDGFNTTVYRECETVAEAN